MKKIIEAALRAAVEKASSGDVFAAKASVDALVAEASAQLTAELEAKKVALKGDVVALLDVVCSYGLQTGHPTFTDAEVDEIFDRHFGGEQKSS